MGTNICQILTPIIGLFVVHALRKLGESSLDMFTDRSLYIPIPYIFNIPYKPFQALASYFNISDCNQWYLFDFAEEATSDTREFWGENRGQPMLKPKSHGLINGKRNILGYPCKEINRSVPYFEELDRNKYDNNNDYLSSVITILHEQKVDYSDRNYAVEHLDLMPDGMITVEEASPHKLKYKL